MTDVMTTTPARKNLPKRALGNSGLSVTVLGFGAAPLGNLYREVSHDDSYAAVGKAWEAGMRYFDTAPFYGFGLSEHRLGNIVRYRDRKDFVVSTKVGRLLRPVPGHTGNAERYGFCSPMPFDPYYDYSYDGVMRSFEDSLQRLGLAEIDILLVHDIGELTHGKANRKHWAALESGGYRALDELRSGGLVKAIELGMNAWQVCEAAMEIGRWDCFLLAGRYTLLEQRAMDSFMPKCAEHGASLIIGGAYNSGILATGVRHDGALHYDYGPPPQSVIDRVSGIEELCDVHGITLAAAALQFPLAHDLVATVIPGIGSARRVEQTMDLYAEKIPSSFWRDLKSAGFLRKEVPTP